jgi:hypothetical protein
MKLDWRRGILYVAVIGIEGCWLYAMMALLNKKVADDGLSVFGILLLYLISLGLNGLLRWLRWPRICIRVINWVGWAAGMLLVVKIQLFGGMAWSDTTWLMAVPRAIADIIYTFKPELLILISSAVIWWLGRRLASLKMNFAVLVGEFQFGLFILIIAFFTASQIKVDLAHSVYIIVAFFLFSLPGISVAHALEGTGWLSGLRQGHWSGLLLISISLILIVGFIISLVVTPDLLQLIVAALKWVWGIILKIMDFLASLMPAPEPSELPEPVPMPAIEPSEESGLWTMPEFLRSGLRLAWSIMMAGLLLFALWRISTALIGWLRRRLAATGGAEYEQMPGAFRADLLRFLKNLLLRLLGLRRLFRRKAGAEPIVPEIASVRQIYRQFLSWAAAFGFPRQMSQTPHEYLYEMVRWLPEAEGDMDLITQQYVRARYGARLLTEDELHQLKQSWYNVKQSRPPEDRRKV